MESLNLPQFDIPLLKRKRVPPAAFYQWLIRNIRLLQQSGQLDRILKQPARRPVDVRFVL